MGLFFDKGVSSENKPHGRNSVRLACSSWQIRAGTTRRILKLEDDRVKEPHPRTIRKLAQALEVDPAELVE